MNPHLPAELSKALLYSPSGVPRSSLPMRIFARPSEKSNDSSNCGLITKVSFLLKQAS